MKLLCYIILLSATIYGQKPFTYLWKEESVIENKFGWPDSSAIPRGNFGAIKEWTYNQTPDKDATTKFYFSNLEGTAYCIQITWKAPIARLNKLWKDYFAAYKKKYNLLNMVDNTSAEFMSNRIFGLSRKISMELKVEELEITMYESYD